MHFALNLDASSADIAKLRKSLPKAGSLIERYGDDQKILGVQASHTISTALDNLPSLEQVAGPQRIALRADAYRLLAELETIGDDGKVPKPDTSAFIKRSAPW